MAISDRRTPASPSWPTTSSSPGSRRVTSDALDVLLERYRRFARAKARGYFLVGGDSDDIEQEALIGLYKAARDFRPERQASLPGLRRAVHHPPDHHRHQDGDPPEAPAAQPVRLDLAACGAATSRASARSRTCSTTTTCADPADEVVSDERMDAMRRLDGRDALRPRGRRAPPLRRGQDATRRSASTSAAT